MKKKNQEEGPYVITPLGVLVRELGEEKGLLIYNALELTARRLLTGGTPAIVWNKHGGTFIGVEPIPDKK